MNPNPNFICKRGHLRSKVGVSQNGTCRQCSKDNSNAYRLKYPDRVKEIKLACYRKKKHQYDTVVHDWKIDHPEYLDKVAARQRSYRLKTKYGITAEQYEKALALQSGVCALCGNPPKNMRLSVDHVHAKEEANKRVRGLLDYRCNKFLVGRWKKEHAALLRKAADYLESDFDIRNL